MPSELTNLRGKLIGGRLTDIRPYQPHEDQTDTVPLVEMPTTEGPFGYDGGSQTAIQLTIPNEVSETATIATTSPVDRVAGGMSLTPEVGTYDVLFTANVTTGHPNQQATLSIWFNGTLISSSQAAVPRNPNSTAATTAQARVVVTANGSQVVEGRWRTSSGVVVMGSRTLKLLGA